nr:DUF2530 domain-containing protein [Phytoactinopolyspora alkaliphila]
MGNGRRRHREAPHVQPMDVDGVRTVSILTVLWAVAFVALAFNRERLDEAGIGWLLWTCLAGVGLGLLGLEYTRKRREAIALSLLEEEAEDDDASNHDDDAQGADDNADVAEDQHGGPAQSTPQAQNAAGGNQPETPPDVIPTKPIPRAGRPQSPREDPPRNTQTMSATPQSSLPPVTSDSPLTATPPVTGTTPTTGTSPIRATPPVAAPVMPGGPTWSGAPMAPATSPDTASPTTPERRSTGSAGPRPNDAPSAAAHEPAEPADPVPVEPGKRRRKQSLGPARPGRVDVGDVSDLAPRIGPPASDARARVTESDVEISPMWSELIDTTSTRQSQVSAADPDEPLIDETTLGGRRAKRYDMQEDIDEITEGGGGVYRGRRARRRPDSA